MRIMTLNLNGIRSATRKGFLDWLPGQPTTTYHYDGLGRLASIDNFNGTTTYTFDQADRLTALDNRTSDNSVISSVAFPILDGNGNRVREVREEPVIPASLAEASITHNYNPTRNRLESTTTETFGYDNEGQTTDKSGTPYTWDVEHRLTGLGSAQFHYDGVGNRLRVTRGGAINLGSSMEANIRIKSAEAISDRDQGLD